MDLKSLIGRWEQRGWLKRVTHPVSRDLEITEILCRVFRDGGPALLFENIAGTDYPLLTNVFGTWERVWDVFGAAGETALLSRLSRLFTFDPPSGFVDKVKTLWALKGLADIFPKEVDKAPCQRRVLKGPDVDLSRIPVMQCWPKDPGRFITLPVVITRDPLSGKENLGMYRMQIIDERTTALHWHPSKGGERHHEKSKSLGRRLEVACALGCEPAIIYAATAPLPPDVSELLLAGLLMNRPVEMVRCKTVDLRVPATSQFVLEGYVDENVLFPEGPFGDHTGYYTPERPFPVFHVEAVTMDSDPVYVSTAVGWPPLEDALLGKLTEKIFLPFIRLVLPDIVDINMPVAGLFHNFVFVSIDKRYPGQAYKAMDGLWGLGQMSTAKVIAVFDADVDVHNLDEVLFHLGNNVDPMRDVVVRKGPVDILDHASLAEGFGGKMGIDATAKLREEGITRPWPERAVMDGETVRKVDDLWERLGL